MDKPDERFDMTNRTCSIGGCDEPHRAHGLCSKHDKQRRRDNEAAALGRGQGLTPCVVEECLRADIEGQGLCNLHYKRLRRTGSTTARERAKGAESPYWVGDRAGYRAVHGRLLRLRGRASQFECVDCGGRGEDWSYDHTDPNPGFDHRGCPYSTDLSRYQPRCKSCHANFDDVPNRMLAARTCFTNGREVE